MGFFMTNLFAMFIFVYQMSTHTQNQNYSFKFDSHTRVMTSEQEPAESDYKFEDPELAYNILKELDVFEEIDLGYTPAQAELNYNKALIGLRPDFEYCDNHRAYFAYNPEYVFREKNFLTSYRISSVLRSFVIPSIGSDIMPHVGFHTPQDIKKEPVYDMRIDASIFFFFEPTYYIRQIGKQFSCLTQISNHIPGHESLYRKDYVADSLTAYTEKYQSKPHCFNADKFFPKTWSLQNAEQCKKFFEEFNSDRYQQLKEEHKILYFRKIGWGVHEGKGVFPVNDQEEASIREMYKNGELCGKVNNRYLMQAAIQDPLLINGHKADFRIPMLIASTNPMIVYYHDGFMRVSLEAWDPESEERGSFVTNIAVSQRIFDIAKQNGTFEGKTEKELRASAVWTFDTVHEYLMANGYTSDPNWLDNYLRPELKKMMVHLIRMSQDPFVKRSSLFEIYGLDVMLDKDLNLWFIEANSKPGMEGFSDEIKGLFKEFLTDSMEIVFGLLRSRTKRIINYVNYLIREGEAWEIQDGSVHIEDLEAKKQEFNDLTKNYFEPEFEPSPGNSLSKVVDENYYGTKRYMSYLEKDCL